MTEIVLRDETAVATVPTASGVAMPDPSLAPTSALVLWAYEARQAALVAESLSKTSFVPQSLRGRAADITAAILAGQELGLKPMATLRSMDVIQGTPALRAHAMRGLLLSHGHEIELVESTDDRCVMRGRRSGSAEWQTVTWDLRRAAALGLTSKDQWKKQPRTMLIARATGEMSRLIAADAIYAMPYVAEELRDDPAPAADGPAYAPVTVAELTGETPTVEGETEGEWPETPEVAE